MWSPSPPESQVSALSHSRSLPRRSFLFEGDAIGMSLGVGVWFLARGRGRSPTTMRTLNPCFRYSCSHVRCLGDMRGREGDSVRMLVGCGVNAAVICVSVAPQHVVCIRQHVQLVLYIIGTVPSNCACPAKGFSLTWGVAADHWRFWHWKSVKSLWIHDNRRGEG